MTRSRRGDLSDRAEQAVCQGGGMCRGLQGSTGWDAGRCTEKQVSSAITSRRRMRHVLNRFPRTAATPYLSLATSRMSTVVIINGYRIQIAM